MHQLVVQAPWSMLLPVVQTLEPIFGTLTVVSMPAYADFFELRANVGDKDDLPDSYKDSRLAIAERCMCVLGDMMGNAPGQTLFKSSVGLINAPAPSQS